MSRSSSARDGAGARVAAALGIGLAVGAGVCGLRAAGALERADLWLYDALLSRRAAHGPPTAPITLIRIREEEIAAHGHPLPDATLARALRWIASQGPRAIGVDVYRDVPVGDPAGRAELAALAGAVPGLVFIEKLPEPGRPAVAPPEFVRSPDALGFNDLVTDADGVLRRGILMLWDDAGGASLAFGLQLALHALHEEGIALGPDPDDPDRLRLGPAAIDPLESRDGGYAGVDARGFQVLLDFQAGFAGFASHPLQAVLDRVIPAEALRDRIVILGTTATSVRDEFHTALSDAPMDGVAVHAHVADQLLRFAHGEARPMRYWSEGAEGAWLLAWSLLVAVATAAARTPLALGGGLLALGAAFVGATAALFARDVWVPAAGPLAASLGSGALVLADVSRRARAERAVVMDLFGRYVSSAVADELWERRDEFMEGHRPRNQRLVITAMLTDLSGYTSAAEKMDPDALMHWVNDYMDAMTQVIEAHGGFVDDYTGDGIKANFGVPLRRDAPAEVALDARSAVRCALAMGRRLQTLNADWERRALPTARMRIGLFTGEAVVGSLGSRARMKYTTVGDTVNTAARLESFRKEDFEAEAAQPGGPPFRVLVGGSTHRHLGDRFETASLGEHVLRGRGAPIPIHRVYDERTKATGDTR